MGFSSDISRIVEPLEGNNLPVAIQDQITEIVAIPLSIEVATGNLLASGATQDSTTITLTPGTGAVAGNVICLFENLTWYHGTILDFTDDVATMDTPLDAAFSTSAWVRVGNPNLNVDGTTPKYAELAPRPGVKWYVTRIHVSIIDNAVMDSSTFGGISALAKGCVLRRIDGNHKNILNAKKNGDLALAASVYEYDPKPPAGLYGFSSKHVLAGQEHAGVALRLNGASGDRLRLLIQDDLTGLTSFRILVIGHGVQD